MTETKAARILRHAIERQNGFGDYSAVRILCELWERVVSELMDEDETERSRR